MTQEIQLVRILKLDEASIDCLVEESLSQGFRFVERLIRDYQTGENRFDETGEVLFGALFQAETIAIGGLNRDPYFVPSNFDSLDRIRVGRLRHVYVMSAWRGRGVGRLLVERLIREAIPHYDRLTLRTDTAADRFYQKLGFITTAQSEHTTHYLELKNWMV